ncbi:hypothetical protein THAOC_13778, partial [Thalassiosira oceanica]
LKKGCPGRHSKIWNLAINEQCYSSMACGLEALVCFGKSATTWNLEGSQFAMPTAIESSVPFEAEEAVLEDGDAELPEPFADEANEVAIPLEFMSNAAQQRGLLMRRASTWKQTQHRRTLITMWSILN